MLAGQWKLVCWVRKYAVDARKQMAHRLAADIGMPDFGIEPDNGRLEGVIIGDLDVEVVGTSGVRCVRRPWETAFEMTQVAWVDRLSEDSGVVLVIIDVR